MNGHHDHLELLGSLELVLQREDGSVEVTRKDNIIVNVGFDFIADAIGKSSSRPAVMGYIALGTDTGTAPAAAQTALVAELSRIAATYAHTAGTKILTFSATFNAGVATGAIAEAGVFNDATVGTMFDRVQFSVVNKGALDVLTATFTFTMS